MAALILPRRFYSQPQFPAQIDFSNSLCVGIGTPIVPASANGISLVGTPTTAITAQGVAHKGDGVNFWWTGGGVDLVSNGASFLIVSNFGATTNNTVGGFGGTAGNQTFMINWDGSASARQFARQSNGGTTSFNNFSDLTAVSTTIDVFICTYDGTLANNLAFNVYRNGRSDSGTSAGNFNGSFSGLNTFAIGGARRSSNSFAQSGQSTLLGLYWNRPLHADEIFALSLNPWQVFKASPRKIFLGAAAGIAFDAAANSGYQSAQSTYTFNRTVTGSNTFLAVDVELLSVPGTTVTSVVDDSGGGNVNMSFIGAKSTVSGAGRVECWGLAAPTTGTKTIQVNLSASIASAATAVSYTGVHQTSPTEAFNSAQATNVGAADATVNITPVADNTVIHGACVSDDTAITANQTTRNNVTGTLGSGADEDTGPISPAALTAISYTNVDALKTWAIAGYAIRPIAASNLGSYLGAYYNRLIALIGG